VAEAKVVLFYLSNILGYSVWAFAMISNLEIFQKLVLFLLAAAFGVIKAASAWEDYKRKKFDNEQNKYEKMEGRKSKSEQVNK
jgi:predicted outer membrane lipoprotein